MDKIKETEKQIMEIPKIDLLDPQMKKRGKIKNALQIFAGIFLILVLFFAASNIVAYYLTSPDAGNNNTGTSTNNPGLFATAKHLIQSGENPLLGETDGRINVLFLGMGGEGHDGPYLTDTIILVSFDTKTKKAALISIPRDLMVEFPVYGWRKINNANAFGEETQKNEGGKYAKETIGKTLGIPIHYYIRINFDGFTQLIDDFGGVSIYVDRAFTDPLYPTDNHLTRTIRFRQGWQVMDGETALQYARSRHGTNNEGSDFARSKRQQKIILSLKNTIFSFGTLFSPGKISSLINSVQKNVKTDFEIWEIIKFANTFREIKNEDIIRYSIDAAPGGLLAEKIIEEAYVLEPRTGNFTEIKNFVKNIFYPGIADNPDENIRVEVQNGTHLPGLAQHAGNIIKNEGYEITKIGNAETREYQKTIIYDFSNGKHPEELAKLKDKLDANVSATVPSWLTSLTLPSEVTLSYNAESGQGIDFLVIVGAANYWTANTEN